MVFIVILYIFQQTPLKEVCWKPIMLGSMATDSLDMAWPVNLRTIEPPKVKFTQG